MHTCRNRWQQHGGDADRRSVDKHLRAGGTRVDLQSCRGGRGQRRLRCGARGIEDGLLGSDYAPIVVPGHWNPAEELDRARLLIARRVDAMVILGGNLPDEQVSDMARKLPIAITGRDLRAPNLFSLHCDQVEGACRATRHLIELGHTRIAHISGPVQYPDAIDRRDGYMRAHSAAALT